MKTTHQVLARKWRPHRFEEVIGQPHVVQALSNALNQQYLHHAYLLTGTRGVGKTTIARIFAKCLNCERGVSAAPCDTCTSCQEVDAGCFPDLYEIDAASRTKVEDTRALLDNVQYLPTKGRYKVYLIDEVHMLSGHSFNALLKTLEEPPSHVKFLLATTDYQRLPATILSRCLQFHLLQMSPEQIAQQVQNILQKEQVEYDVEATFLVGKAANGSMRDALSLLDQCIAFGNGKVITAETKSMLGTIEPTTLYELLTAIHLHDGNQIMNAVNELALQGADFSKVLAELLAVLHQVALIQAIPNLSTATEYPAAIHALAQQISREDVQLYYQIALLGQRDFPFAPTPRIGFEMPVLRMLAFKPHTMGIKTNASNNSSVKNSTITAAPKTSPSATTTVSTQPHSGPINSWPELLLKLNLSGAALALAQQCSMKIFSESKIQLILHPNFRALLQPKQVARIHEALNNYLGKTIEFNIDVGTPDSETPADLTRREQEKRKHDATDAIFKDETVQRIMQTFDAKIIETSIEPV